MDEELSAITALLPQIIAAIPVILAIIVGALVVNYLARRALRLLADRTSLTPQDVAPFGKIARWLITLVAMVLILSVLGFRIGGVWAVLSTVLAMVAIGFVAVWSVLSNTLCTLLILIFRPFAIGDEIEFAGDPVKGRVVDLNFIFTTLEGEDGMMIQIPNNLFFQKVLKRRHGMHTVSLAEQLNQPTAAPAAPTPVR